MNLSKNILVCVTKQKTCERLIRKAAEYIIDENTLLFVIHVVGNSCNFLDSSNENEGEALEYLFGISKSVGAQLSVLKSDNIIETIINYAIDNKIGKIFLGESHYENNENCNNKENNFNIDLLNNIPYMEIIVVPQISD